MSSSVDAIVLGSGPNGLTAATRLARAGRRVLVLERRAVVGGVAAAEEFHPGYRSAGLLADTTMVKPRIVEALDLHAHGLRMRDEPPTVLALGDGRGEPLPISGRVEAAAEAIARVSTRDAEQYRAWDASLRRLAPAVEALFGRSPIDLIDLESQNMWDLGSRAMRIRRLGRDDLRELLRLPAMSVADVLGERFETERLRAALCLPACLPTFGGPWQPGNVLELLRRRCLGGPGVVGGGPMLVAALEGAARAAGVELRTEAVVEALRVGAEGVEGVTLEGGETIDATLVAAATHPRHALSELLPAGVLPARLEHRIGTFRSRGRLAVLRLALSRPPRFSGTAAERARTGEHVDELERAFDATKYGDVTDSPVLDLHVPTESDPALAPEGHAVLSATVCFVPHDRRGGWTEPAREALITAVLERLSQHDEGLPDAVVARELLTPTDLETRYELPGGHLFHGEHGMDQLLLRPTPECLHYSTPVPGLWLCGGGSHPGGGISCTPGDLAATAILAAT